MIIILPLLVETIEFTIPWPALLVPAAVSVIGFVLLRVAIRLLKGG